ncbi:hypothetical protein [Nocardioides perillae]|uniref:Uncharacterized protein n=1 Tax=Nocardioides perillae TaxID=1119534 RepID=A0A7Y9UN74_9ACTN|nr:hypothetical protein [Nocardioides perillae]NYG56892.1 hypothetical protein [Nocardioides perillae]
MSPSDPSRPHHRPTQPGSRFFEAVAGGADPAEVREAADRAAVLLVRGARGSDDEAVADRLLHLAETEGLETIADLWSGAPADSLAGALFRLYLLRSWVHAAPVAVAREYDAGRARAQVARVVAGVADPPGPDELRAMVDEVLRGIAERDFADVLLRASAFARVVATGRATLGLAAGAGAGGGAERVLTLAEQLEHAAHLELRHGLA